MNTKPISIGRTFILAAAGLLILSGAPSAAAADIEPSSLRTSAAPGFLGEWALTVDVEGGPSMHMLLNFVDVKGKLGATLQKASQASPQVITDITEASLALKLRYHMLLGDTEVPMALILRISSAGVMTGSLGDIGAAEGEEGHGFLGLGLFAARVHGTKGGKIPGRAILDLDGEIVRITYVAQQTKSPDFKAIAGMKDGDVVRFTRARAAKLFTDVDLRFGNEIIMAENAGKNYPGVYSLWLKKAGSGWNLVFNSEPDIWGTMRDPGKDVAEVPLVSSKLSEEERKFVVDLTEDGDGGVLRLAWGPNEWKTKFSVVR